MTHSEADRALEEMSRLVKSNQDWTEALVLARTSLRAEVRANFTPPPKPQTETTRVFIGDGAPIW